MYKDSKGRHLSPFAVYLLSVTNKRLRWSHYYIFDKIIATSRSMRGTGTMR